jgi:hypothetical protein
MIKNENKYLQLKKSYIFLKSKLQFTCPQAFRKDVQATEEAFSPQKRTQHFKT